MPIGEALARARQRAGLTVAQVSEQTCIREAIIRAIEQDDFSACGGDFYARGHIRAIAKVVEAEPGPLISEYDTFRRARGALAAVSLDELLTAAARAPQRQRPGPLRAPARTGRGVAVPARARRRTHRLVAVGLALAVLLGLAAYRLLASSPHVAAGPPAAPAHAAGGNAGAAPRPEQARGARQAAAPPPTAAAPRAHRDRRAQPLAPARAAAFGPGGGDNPQLARLAIDGRRGTGWRTDWYTSARFGNLYRGTGLLLVMRRTAAITGVQVTLGRVAGTSFQLRVGARPVLARMRPAAHATGAHGTVRLRLPRAAHGRYVLVWLTRLPRNRGGNFQAGIYNIKLRGHW